ncbi:MAG: protein kinase [Planctomycetota bacterium]
MGQELLNDRILDRVPVIAGHKVLEPCVLLARLGKGGMGVVYRARHLNLGIDVALKCLNAAAASGSDEFEARMRREARLAAELSHQNLIRVFDVGVRHGVPHIVMELVAGETLTQRVRRRGALPPREVITIIAQAARGLGAAHAAEACHRDVKPDNLMISRKGVVKVADLGLAKAANCRESFATSTGLAFGTPQYMPPEQFEDASSVDARADVYALGATAFYALTGHHGIEGDSLTEIMRQICLTGFPRTLDAGLIADPELARLIDRATATSRAERPRDGNAFAAELDAWLARHGGPVPLDESDATVRAEDVAAPPAEIFQEIARRLAEGGVRDEPYLATEPQLRNLETPPVGPVAVASTGRRGRGLLAAGIVGLVLAGGGLAASRVLADPGPEGPVTAAKVAAAPDPEPEKRPGRAADDDGTPDFSPPGPPVGPEAEEGVGHQPKDEDTRVSPSEVRDRDWAALSNESLEGDLEGLAVRLRDFLDRHPDHGPARQRLGRVEFLRTSSAANAGQILRALDATRRFESDFPDAGFGELRSGLTTRLRDEVAATIDFEDPRIPLETVVLSDSEVILRGRFAHEAAVELRCSRGAARLEDGGFEIRIPDFPDGENEVKITFVARHDVEIEITVKVRIVTQAPRIDRVVALCGTRTVLPGGAELLDLGGTIVVEGEVANVNGGSLRVAGRRVETDASGHFRLDLGALEEREHEIRVVAVNALGAEVAETLRFRVDRTAPYLLVDSPALDRATRDASVPVNIRVRDAGRISEIRVDGRPIGFEADGAGAWRARADVFLRREGRNNVEIVAFDAAGNTSRSMVSFTRDSIAPQASLAPRVRRQVQAGRRLDVILENVSPDVVAVRVNGQDVGNPRDRAGRLTIPFVTPEVRPGNGRLAITVELKDAAGNVGVLRFEVELTPSAAEKQEMERARKAQKEAGRAAGSVTEGIIELIEGKKKKRAKGASKVVRGVGGLLGGD